jgi:hypothetical protein
VRNRYRSLLLMVLLAMMLVLLAMMLALLMMLAR